MGIVFLSRIRTLRALRKAGTAILRLCLCLSGLKLHQNFIVDNIKPIIIIVNNEDDLVHRSED